MFRISQYMEEIAQPTPLGPKRNPPGPVVIWNLIRRCNLTCKHCYSISADKDFPGELSTAEIYGVMDDLKRFRVPVLILSGGEPLLRPDIFDIARRAKALGFYVGLSSNGTLIDETNIAVSRRLTLTTSASASTASARRTTSSAAWQGAFEKSLHGIRLCRDLGLKIGVRFTMTQDNAHDLPGLLRLVEDEGIDRFYFSHLNYAGRGNKNRKDDAHHQMTREAMDLLFETCLAVPAARPGEGVHHRQQRRRRRVLPALGGAALPGHRRRMSGRSWRSGAATPPASTSPTSTTSATCTPTPCGGTTPSATCASGRSRRSGRTSPTRSWPASRPSRARSAAAAAPAPTSTSATATPACAPSSSPATPGRKTRAAISPTRRSASNPLKHQDPNALAVPPVGSCAALAAEPAPELYRKHCAECHGADRFGLMGPALLPENLSRLRKPDAAAMIRDSRPTVQMPPFKDVLKPEEIQQLADYIYTPVSPMPQWGEQEIRASRIVHHAPGSLPDKPQFAADMMNLFIVVEGGDHHVTILDGDRLEPIHRFPSRFALHGGPKFTPDGRYVFFASRDGWISKFDIWNLKVVAEVRAGINTRNAAVSGDGKYVAVANYLPHSLVILDAELNPLKIHAVRDRTASRARASPPSTPPSRARASSRR